MPRKPLYEVADPAENQVFHAVQRCVRRAFSVAKIALQVSLLSIDAVGFVIGWSFSRVCSVFLCMLADGARIVPATIRTAASVRLAFDSNEVAEFGQEAEYAP